MTSAFSMPPMRCSRPAVPGTAHGRARVSSSRRKGWKVGSPLGSTPLGSAGELDVQVGQLVDARDAPRLGPVGEVAVGQQEDRGAVGRGDAHGIHGGAEAVGRRLGGHDRHGRLAVAAEHRLEEVGLLGLGGQAGGGAAALDVDDDQRQLEGDGQPDRLGLQGDAGAARGGDADGAAEAGAEGDADAGDLVLGLHRRDAVPLEGREGVQDVGGRGDRVRAQHEGEAGAVRGGHEAEREGGVAGDVAVGARRHLRGGDEVGGGEVLGRLAVVPAGAQGGQVGLEDVGAGAELLGEEGLGAGRRAGVHPREQAEGEHVLRPLLLLAGQAREVVEGLDGDAGQGHRVHVEGVEGAVVDRARRCSRPWPGCGS